MKKITLSLFAIAVIALSSCKKDTIGPVSSGNVSNSVQIVSNWLTMNFTAASRENSEALEAVYYFDRSDNYNQQEHTTLAFMKTSDSYRSLPTIVPSEEGYLQISYILSAGSFTVTAKNADNEGLPDASKFSDSQFRYIVVPNSLIRSENIDWTDYSAVANALHIED